MIGLKYTENGGYEMDLMDFRTAQTQALKDKGIIAFEKRIGRIEWLHPIKSQVITSVKSDKNYAVIDVLNNEVTYEAQKLFDIAKEFGVSIPAISKCLNLSKLLNEKYMIVRCEHE